MSFNPTTIKALIFDYGNTIIEFSQQQLAHYEAPLRAALTDRYGPCDEERFISFRAESRLKPYAGDPPHYRENNLRDVTAHLIQELYGQAPTPEALEQLRQLRFESFVKVIEMEPETLAILERLAQHYPLALLSNYPDAPAIRASLEKIGLTPLFHPVVVSDDLGYVKPHPMTFEAVLGELGLEPEDVLFVGDNWLADVQGAKQAGMFVAHMQRWAPPEHFEANPDDHQPDLVITHLSELEELLLTDQVEA